MKRIWGMILALMLFFSAAQAQEYPELLVEKKDEGIWIQDYVGTAMQYMIPSEIDGIPVVGIGEGAFSNNALLGQLTVPESVIYISDMAFEGSPLLYLAVYPGSVAERYAQERNMRNVIMPELAALDFSSIPEEGVNPFSGVDAIAALQQLLVRAGLLPVDDATGIYNKATRDAVVKLCEEMSVQQGEMTIGSGMSVDAPTMIFLTYYPHRNRAEEGDITPYSQTDAILEMQNQLAALGHMDFDDTLGMYDFATLEAVMSFQQEVNGRLDPAQQIEVTGICDEQTKLYLEYMVYLDETDLGLMMAPTKLPEDRMKVELSEAPVFPLTQEKAKEYATRISAGAAHMVALNLDGTVRSMGENGVGQCDVEHWEDVVAVSAGSYQTVALTADGTVHVMGYDDYGKNNTGSWQDIVAIAAGGTHNVGLKSDGTVVAVGHNDDGECNTEKWKDIVAIDAGDLSTVGLKADGTVVVTGYRDAGQQNTRDWFDIVSVAAGWHHTVGLKADGTVLAVGYEYDGACDTASWSDVVEITAGFSHTVALKADGTVLSTGDNEYGQCDTDDWTDIIAIDADENCTIGLKADGAVCMAGVWPSY